MIFRPELAALVVKGQKTATRRGVVFDNERAMWRIDKPWRYPVGKRFAVQPGRGKHAVAEAIVTARWIEPLSALTPLDARREGFPTRDAFVDAFTAINGAWEPDQRVHVVEFELTGSPCPSCGGEGVQRGHAGTSGVGPFGFRGVAIETERPCFDCYGTGKIVTKAAVELIAQLEQDTS